MEDREEEKRAVNRTLVNSLFIWCQWKLILRKIVSWQYVDWWKWNDSCTHCRGQGDKKMVWYFCPPANRIVKAILPVVGDLSALHFIATSMTRTSPLNNQHVNTKFLSTVDLNRFRTIRRCYDFSPNIDFN